MEKNVELLKSLPKVDSILNDDRIKNLNNVPYSLVIGTIREELDSIREGILNGIVNEISTDEIVNNIINSIENKNEMHLKRVINATGTVLHTNLGRACLKKAAVEAVVNTSQNYSNLEFDLEKGERGSRYSHVEKLICKITGAQAAMVVNNNAAAVMLVLSTLCKEKEAIVSRGQLVEVGGSFRIPAVMEQSGAKLMEVGTTNRTHLYDYESAINSNTGVILRVHQSNYKILGFTEEVPIEELKKLGEKYSIPVVEDIGSGIFIDLEKYGFVHEPTVQESILKGIDVVTFSGDKMLGGPQAGIIAGKKQYIDLMKKNQLTRALRVDKMTLAALEATLRLYLDESAAVKEIPCLNMLTMDINEIKKRAHKLSRMLNSRIKNRAKVKVIEDYSQVGGGAMPTTNIKTYSVAVKPLNKLIDNVEYGLRRSKVPIVARINNDMLIFDVRTLFDRDYKTIADTMDKLL